MKKFFSSSTLRRNLMILLGVFALIIAIAVTKKSRDGNVSSDLTAHNQKDQSQRQENASSNDPSTARSEPKDAKDATPDGTEDPPVNRSPLSQAAQQRTIMTASGVRKQLIDPMASWQDLPPWPEGLQLFAEVETASSRFVNLRPDDVGQMPRIQADASERIAIKISIPEADPGEKIHVELPNGGRFTDSDSIGRVMQLDNNRTLNLDYITDDSMGHCEVKFFHRGNTRSLPIWIGKLP
jgi:hypothetical protein